MEAMKLVFLLCIAVLYTCAQVPELRKASPRTKEQLKASVETLYEELKEAVESAINSSVSAIEKMYSRLNTTVENQLEGVESVVNSTFAVVLEEISALEAEATEADVNITDCTNDVDSEIEELAGLYEANLTACYNDLLVPGENYTSKIISEVEAVIDEVTTLGDQLTKCAEYSQTEAVICYAEVEAKIAAYIISLPAKIAIYTEEDSEFISEIIYYVYLCPNSTLASVTEAYEIVANVTECVDSALNSTSVY